MLRRFLPTKIITTTIVLTTSLLLTACVTGPYKDNLPLQDYPTLEVIKVYNKENNTAIVSMIELTTHRKYGALMNPTTLREKYVPLNQGDRVKIAGSYQAGRVVPIANIREIKKLPNLDKTACESNNKVWQPIGELQIPTCVSPFTKDGL